MKDKTLLLIVITILLSIAILNVRADNEGLQTPAGLGITNLEDYITFDSNTTSDIKSIAPVAAVNTIVSGCVISGCANFDGTNDYINYTKAVMPTAKPWTYLWMGKALSNTNVGYWWCDYTTAALTYPRLNLEGAINNLYDGGVESGGGGQTFALSGTQHNLTKYGLLATNWNMYGLSANASQGYMATSVNGVNYIKDTDYTNTAVPTVGVLFGNRPAMDRDLYGQVDEWMSFNIELSQASITTVYNDLLKGVRVYDNITTITNLAVPSKTNNSIYVTWTKPTNRVYNHTGVFYNCTGGALTFVSNETTGTLKNITGLTNNTKCTIQIWSYAHNDVATSVSAYITNTTSVNTIESSPVDTTPPSLNFSIISVTNSSVYMRVGANESFNWTQYYGTTAAMTSSFSNSTNVTGDRYYNLTGLVNNTFYYTKPMVCDQNNNCANLTYTANFTTLNNTAPTVIYINYSTNSTNSTLAGTEILHSLSWSTNGILSSYIFSFCNGTWTGSSCGSTASSVDWANTSYDKRKQINLTNVAGEVLVNYTYYINLSYDSDMQSNYHDIAFYDNMTEISFEVDKTTATEVYVWLKIPSFPIAGEQIYVYYKNNTAVNNRNNSNSVWSAYGSVYHLNEVNSSDSAGGSASGTTTGTVTLDGGRIGNAVNFTSTSRINLGIAEAINLSDRNTYTVEYWINTRQTPGVDHVHFAQSQGSCSWNIATGTYDADVVNANYKLSWRDDSGTTKKTVDSGVAEIQNTWQYLAYTYNVGTAMGAKVYVNGVFKQNNSNTLNGRTGITSTQIGYGCDFGSFVGVMDEFRISKSEMSAGWINQTYLAINNQSRYVLTGVEESRTVSSGGWVNDTAVTFGGTANTSTAKKTINSTVGITYAWCFYANTTTGVMNDSCSNPYSYTSTSPCSIASVKFLLPTATANYSHLNNTGVQYQVEVNVTGTCELNVSLDPEELTANEEGKETIKPDISILTKATDYNLTIDNENKGYTTSIVSTQKKIYLTDKSWMFNDSGEEYIKSNTAKSWNGNYLCDDDNYIIKNAGMLNEQKIYIDCIYYKQNPKVILEYGCIDETCKKKEWYNTTIDNVNRTSIDKFNHQVKWEGEYDPTISNLTVGIEAGFCFNTNSTNDTISNKYGGTREGNVEWKGTSDWCIDEGCMHFHGGNDVENGIRFTKATNDFGNCNNDCTISFMMRLNATDNNVQTGVMATKALYNDVGGYQIYTPSNGNGTRWRTGGDNAIFSAITQVSCHPWDVTPCRETWYHFTFRKSNTNFSIYVNGVYLWSNSSTYYINSSTNDLLIGKYEDGSGDAWWGLLDNIIFYNDDLSDSKITELYNINNNCSAIISSGQANGIVNTTKGLVPQCPSSSPFCTQNNNPIVQFNATPGSYLINWTVNATGTSGDFYDFFANVTEYTDSSNKKGSNVINVTITSPIPEPVWITIGNHTAGNTVTWNSTAYIGQTFTQFRCKAIDLEGSGNYSDYLTLATNFTVGEEGETIITQLLSSVSTILMVIGD